MKAYKILFTAAAAMLALAACNNEREPIADEREELQLSGEIHNAEVQNANLTRGTFTAGNKFTLYVENNSSTGYFTGLKKSTATILGESGGKNSVQLEPKLYWDDLGGKNADLNLYGVYPHTAPVTGSSTINWTINADGDVSDLMRAYLPYDYAQKGTPAHMQFEHVLSKITIIVKPGNGYTQAELDQATVKYTIHKTGTYDFVSNLASGTSGDIELKYNNTTNVAKDDYREYTIFSYPFGTTDNYTLATISITKNNADSSTSVLTYNVILDGVEMKPGEHYEYAVTVSKTDVTVEASVVNWVTESDDLSTQFIIPTDIDIEDADGIEVSAGSQLYLYVNDGVNTGKTTYEYDGDSWSLYGGAKHLYWDDFKKEINITALLVLDGDGTTGENILTASGSANGFMKTIDLVQFKRPFAKITIEVKTSDGEDKVNIIDGLDYIEFIGSREYAINYAGNLAVTGPDTNDLVNVPFGTDATSVTAYILPYSVPNGGTLCKVGINETVDILNEYNVKFDGETSWVAGTHYTYEVTITKTVITVTAEVIGWTSGTGGNIDSQLD